MQITSLETQLQTLQAEKEALANLLHGLRGTVDQTSLVLERSRARFVRLHDQLSVTRDSLSFSQLSSSRQGINEEAMGRAQLINDHC